MKVALKAMLLVVLAATPAAAQDSSTTSVNSAPEALYRDPHKARVFGAILPGAGYVYAGEYLRGYATWVATIGGLAFGPVIYNMDSCGIAIFSDCTPSKTRWPYRLAGILLVADGVWTWGHGAYDAGRAAERANERHRRKLMEVRPTVTVEPGAVRQLQAGLRLDW
jgi:hypothetical protein